jgi:dTDP-glucose pyrophosphorylase
VDVHGRDTDGGARKLADGTLGAFLLAPGDSALDALGAVRANGRGIGAVVERNGRLLGTVLDSDIRRAALAGDLVDASVADVMTDRPTVADARASDDEVLDLLQSHRLRSVPVVEDGIFMGVRSLEEFGARVEPVAVIMAGGRGQRLRPLTDKVPKPLLKVGAQSIVERLIASLVAAGVRDVYLAVNYKHDVFEERLGTGELLGARLHYVKEEHELGTAGALSLLPDIGDRPLIVSNGDIVTTLDFGALHDFHWRHGGAVTVTGVHHLSHIPYGVLRTAGHHLLEIEEKPERRDLCSAGVYMLEPSVLPLVPSGEAVTMPELIADAVGAGLPVNVFPILERWFDIGGPAEFERVLVQFATGEEE